MQQTLTLSAIILTAFLTLAFAGTAAMRDAGDRSLKQRVELDASIDRMLAERLARRDEPEYFEEAAPTKEAAVAVAETEGVTPRERPRNLDAHERQQAREAAAARMKTKRRTARVPLIRPERLIPDTFRTIRGLTFGLVR